MKKSGVLYSLIIKFFSIIPDKIALKLFYKIKNKRSLNLNNPKRFTEKLQWYKLYYRNPLMTICADKYQARKYLDSKGFSKYTCRLLGVYNNFKEINFDILPDQFVIKSNNGSGTNIFVKNKINLDVSSLKKHTKSWKKNSTISIGKEWAYKNIPYKIIIEEFLIDKETSDSGLNDYKFLCFSGNARYIWVDTNRYTNHTRDFFDLEWNRLNIESDMPNSRHIINKPINLQKMVNIANSIAKDFPFVRVDFYEVNGHLYIGELTFYPWSGAVIFNPDSFDYQLGNLFVLPDLK